jgi:tRNA A-37 threonylcarbamoyl transferase component Bud32
MSSYLNKKHIYDGADGTIFSAMHAILKKKIIIKSMKYDKNYGITGSILKELVILNTLSHKNLIEIIDIEFLPNTVNIIMCEFGCDLIEAQLKDELKDDKKNQIMCEIIDTIGYIHDSGFIHCDLSLKNILIDENDNIKLIDFSSATRIHRTNNIFSPTCYVCPNELLVNMKIRQSEKIDIWSLGCVLYFISTGMSFFPSTDYDFQYACIASISDPANNIFNHRFGLLDDSHKFITRMLSLNPSNRPTIKQIKKNKFLKDNQCFDNIFLQSELEDNNTNNKYDVFGYEFRLMIIDMIINLIHKLELTIEILFQVMHNLQIVCKKLGNIQSDEIIKFCIVLFLISVKITTKNKYSISDIKFSFNTNMFPYIDVDSIELVSEEIKLIELLDYNVDPDIAYNNMLFNNSNYCELYVQINKLIVSNNELSNVNEKIKSICIDNIVCGKYSTKNNKINELLKKGIKNGSLTEFEIVEFYEKMINLLHNTNLISGINFVDMNTKLLLDIRNIKL